MAIEQTIEIELNVESGPNTPYEFIPKAIDFQEHISDFVLFNSFNRLTVNQKRILTLFYFHQMTDTEIASSLGVKQQSIFKSRKNALIKLREGVKENV
uniref:sigma factor-like helix-turn-helix DNA-binding protein n=1 Tax=Psychrobacillus sp. FSL K6-4046 TaxID=2921550 RepID=UPI00406C92B3